MKLKWKTSIVLLVVSIFLIIIPAQVQAGVPEDVFILEISSYGEPESLDPAVCNNTCGGHFITQVYETLYTYKGASTELIPNLAESYIISSDGLQWTFKIRDGVKFSDGTDLNASSYKYSLDRAILMNDLNGPVWMISQVIKGASDYTGIDNPNITEAEAWLAQDAIVADDANRILTINLDSNYIPFLAAMTYHVGSAISPSWIYRNLDKAEDADGTAYTFNIGDNNTDQIDMKWWYPALSGKPSGIVPGQQNDFVNKHMCGTGSYKLDKWEPNKQVSLVRNDDWWKIGKTIEGVEWKKPALKEIYSKIVAETATRILDIKNADCDAANVPATNMPEIYHMDSGKIKILGLRVTLAPSFTVMYIGACLNDTLNFAEGTEKYLDESSDSTYDGSKFDKYGSKNSDTSKASDDNPFSALKFRKAIAHAFDYDKFIDNAVNGWGERMVGVIPKGMFGHQDTLDLPEHNPSLAKSLFREVGWQGTFVLGYDIGNDIREAGCLLLEDVIEDLDVGISVTVKKFALSEYNDHIEHQHLGAFFVNWSPDYADPDNYADSFLNSAGEIARRQVYKNTDIDDALNAAKTEQNDSVRAAYYKTIEEAAAADIAQMYCYQATAYMVNCDSIYGLEKLSSNPMYSYRYYAELYKGDPYFYIITDDTQAINLVFGLGAIVMISLILIGLVMNGLIMIRYQKKRE